MMEARNVRLVGDRKVRIQEFSRESERRTDIERPRRTVMAAGRGILTFK